MTPILPDHPVLLTSPSSVGPVVRMCRKAQQIRIDDAAALLGVSVDLMSRLENGQGSVRLDKLMTVLDGLGLALAVMPKTHPWYPVALEGARTLADEHRPAP